MIDLRVVLVTAASAFLSLAVGVALGSGPLLGETDMQARARAARLDKQQQSLRTQITALRAGDAYRDTFASDISPDLVKDVLSDRTVVLVALPDADPRLVHDLRAVLGSAGARVTGEVRMRAAWVDPGKRQFLADLSARLAGDAARSPGPAYDLADAVLARALLAKKAPPSAKVDESSTTAIGAFGEGGVLTAPSDLRRSELAVVVAPEVLPSATSSDPAGRAGTAAAPGVVSRGWLALARALDDAGNGVVVASGSRGTGPAGHGGPTSNHQGLVTALRGDAAAAGRLSSVDVADLPSGRIAVVLALAEQRRGGVGQYGADASADRTLPEPPGS